MAEFFLSMLVLLLLTLVAGLWAVLRGPSPSDRIMAAQLFGSIAVACVFLLSEAFDRPELQDVALVFALLAAVTSVAFVRRFIMNKKQNHADD